MNEPLSQLTIAVVYELGMERVARKIAKAIEKQGHRHYRHYIESFPTGELADSLLQNLATNYDVALVVISPHTETAISLARKIKAHRHSMKNIYPVYSA